MSQKYILNIKEKYFIFISPKSFIQSKHYQVSLKGSEYSINDSA